MGEWVDAILMGMLMLMFVLGLSTILMGVTASEKDGPVIQQRVEYGFMGVSALVICLLMLYGIS